jgi:phosphoglycolate phosphatase-like HAD superfamily hydrolase
MSKFVTKRIIAFDFDGVLCNGLAEYFHSSVLAYQSAWQFTGSLATVESIRQTFYDLRPVIETGWEMVVLVHALLQHISPTEIQANWQGVLGEILAETDLTQVQLMATLDQVRDRQITENLAAWLSLHQFYDGMVDGLKQLLADPSTTVYIITTKEARFTEQLLKEQGIYLPIENIFGKEKKQPKAQILCQLFSPELEKFWFIEDRLETLEKVRQENTLDSLQLFLADWGYNNIVDPEPLLAKNIELVDLKLWQTKINQFLNI